MSVKWPDDLHPATIALTVDVEWARPEVLADLRGLFDERGLRATFFCTHADIDVGHHERALHPNFRHNGDALKSLARESGRDIGSFDELEIYRYVLTLTKSFAPEAIGTRSHSLFYDFTLLPLYAEHGLQYDSTYMLPLMPAAHPVWQEHDVLELPIYYSDLFDLRAKLSGFAARGLQLDAPGLKVMNFHPNVAFLNAATDTQYLATKSFYRDPERLLAARNPGHGIRTFLIDLLDSIVARRLPTATLGDINARWRSLPR